MAKHGELAAKIWRTVVFSGAMLGAPLASAETPQANKPVAQADSTAELQALDKKIAAAADALIAAQTDADRTAAKAKLEALRKERAPFAFKAAGEKLLTLEKLEADQKAFDANVTAAIDAVTNAQNDADRQAAKAKLDKLKKEKAELDKKVAAEKAKLSPTDKLLRDQLMLDAKIALGIDAVIAAANDADRKAAKAKLDLLRRERAVVEQKIIAEKAKRPRAKEDERPIGRGFILA